MPCASPDIEEYFSRKMGKYFCGEFFLYVKCTKSVKIIPNLRVCILCYSLIFPFNIESNITLNIELNDFRFSFLFSFFSDVGIFLRKSDEKFCLPGSMHSGDSCVMWCWNVCYF